MTILPLDLAANATPAALASFLADCRQAAVEAGSPRLVSISLAVDALDPLAVLEAIFEPAELHFYAERPGIQSALSGAEVVLSHQASGPGRFAAVQQFVDDTLARTIAVGAVNAPFGGPHFFATFTFDPEAESGEPFPAARVFVPRWQVARAGEVTTAVANLLVGADADVAALAERVWRAHEKFGNFDYSARRQPASGTLTHRAGPNAALLTRREAGDYRAAVRGALEEISAGSFQKIVLARAQDIVAPEPLHPLRMLNGLRQRFPDCYAFSVSDGSGRSFIGASPERLVRISRGMLETEALAGSAPRGATASEDAELGAALLRNEKELREQGHVLESIVRRLGQLGLTVEHAQRPEVRRFANVQHLCTPIRAVLPASVRLMDVLASLHPTPAVGGTPQERALPRIRQLEGFPRGLYAGAIGWINPRGGGEFFVGLRSALVHGAEARLYAGAGIVAGSTPEKEFAETELKFRAILDAVLE